MSLGRHTPANTRAWLVTPTGVTAQRSNHHLYQQKSKQQEGMPETALPTAPSACSQNCTQGGAGVTCGQARLPVFLSFCVFAQSLATPGLTAPCLA